MTDRPSVVAEGVTGPSVVPCCAEASFVAADEAGQQIAHRPVRRGTPVALAQGRERFIPVLLHELLRRRQERAPLGDAGEWIGDHHLSHPLAIAAPLVELPCSSVASAGPVSCRPCNPSLSDRSLRAGPLVGDTLTYPLLLDLAPGANAHTGMVEPPNQPAVAAVVHSCRQCAWRLCSCSAHPLRHRRNRCHERPLLPYLLNTSVNGKPSPAALAKSISDGVGEHEHDGYSAHGHGAPSYSDEDVAYLECRASMWTGTTAVSLARPAVQCRQAISGRSWQQNANRSR